MELLKKYNGWMDRRCIRAYLKYVETVVSYFKGRIQYYIPFNEQNYLFLDSEYMTGYKATSEEDIFTLEHHFNLAYAQATVLIHQCDPQAKTGGNIGNCCYYPATCHPKDIEMMDEWYYRTGLNLADVYFRGVYTKKYLNSYQNVDFSKIILSGDLDIIAKVEADFFSTTYYQSTVIESQNKGNVQNTNIVKGKNPYIKQTYWGWNIDPYGLRHMLEEFYHRYQLPILIMENGLGAFDEVGEDGCIHDNYRIEYLQSHISELQKAIDDGVNVIAYMTWSAIDLYSTREGLVKRYGFIYVDEKTLERKKKKSFDWYKDFIESQK